MARLPVSGQDNGVWGDVLNDYLLQSHTNTGALKQSAVAAAIGDASASDKGLIKLAGDLTGSADTPTVANGAITGGKIAATTITDANIATAAAIAQSKIANLTADLNAKLASANNLSDVANAATARTNLGAPAAVGFATITVGTTPPSSPAVGDIWVDTN
jgi:hypothetical protein